LRVSFLEQIFVVVSDWLSARWSIFRYLFSSFSRCIIVYALLIFKINVVPKVLNYQKSVDDELLSASNPNTFLDFLGRISFLAGFWGLFVFFNVSVV
jgi:hypothetical protein